METHNDAGYGSQSSGQEISPKGHRRKNKVSNVQARLCPNFDLRDILKAEKDNSCTKTYQQSHNEEVLELKTMDFATLLNFIHPTFIIDYLRRVLDFFKSDLYEMSFSNIVPFVEEFLMRIAQDNECLTCSAFSAESQTIGRQILAILHQNRDRYKWEYVYKGGTNVGK